ncbi:MAG: hypothetical protein ACT4P5_19590 [Armatimonadota bacterium]
MEKMKLNNRRRAPLSVVALTGAVLCLSGAAASADPVVAELDGCNEQPVGEGGLTILWTSAFKDGSYGFNAVSKSGNIVSGEGDVLEVTVQWSIADDGGFSTGTPTSFTGIGPRGPGFSPEGVSGMFVGDPAVSGVPTAIPDPSECGIDPGSLSYGIHTFYFTFTDLHQPGRRGGGVAKGNAEFNLFVDVDEGEIGTATLGTNLHVATGAEPPD